MWHTVWNIGGVAYQMPEPGDYLTTELGIDSIIMARQEDGSVKAFFNSCPHRGTRITEAEDGHVQEFSCPYHGWTFDRAGVVTSVPDEEDFAESPCGKARLKRDALRGTIRIDLVQLRPRRANVGCQPGRDDLS